MEDSIAFVIVTFNSGQTIERCLGSIASQGLSRWQIVVVDNASSDNTVEQIRATGISLTLLQNDRNRGFAAACNRGVAATSAGLIMLVNPDARLGAGAVEELRSALRSDERIGIVGPRLASPDGELLPSAYRFPTVFQELAFLLRLKPLLTSRPFRWAFGSVLANRFGQFDPHLRRRRVDTIVGACMLIRRSVWEMLGGLDESFFLFYEEKDLCMRAHDAGFWTVFVPEAHAVHEVGVSTRSNELAAAIAKRMSMMRYYSKHKSIAANIVIRAAILVTTFSHLLVEALAVATGRLPRAELGYRLRRWRPVVREALSTMRRGESGRAKPGPFSA